MEESSLELDFSQMSKWFQVNETVIVPALENTLNEIRNRILVGDDEINDQWIDGQPFNLISHFKNKGIAYAIRRYGLRVRQDPLTSNMNQESGDESSPTQAKKMRTDHGTEDDIVASAIQSAISEKGLK